jgi:hypothetical protein
LNMIDNQCEAAILCSVASRKKKGTWGGARPGAGRKSEVEDPVGFSLDVERADLEAVQEIARARGVSAGRVVRDALRAYLKRRKRG